MKILLFGRDGQLGWELHRCVGPLGNLLAVDKQDLDLTHKDKLVTLISDYQPDLIVNAAAYTEVDRAESEQNLALVINGTAPELMAQGAQSQHAALIHFSTDYVFDGEKGGSYVEGDPLNPINVYGQTKLAGEIAVQSNCESFLILRTSWLYSMRLFSFPTKVLDWSRKQENVRVVDDQVGSPTWCRVLAEITGFLIARANGEPFEYFRDRKGLYHVAGKGSASRYEWAQAILLNDPHSEEQIMKELQRAESSDFQTSAKRPPNSSLDCTLFQEKFKLQIPGWEESLQLAMDGAE